MMELHTIHNEDHKKILRTKCAPFDFTKHSKEEIRAMVKEMRIKMREWHGIGLAATQVGFTESFFVAQAPDGKFHAIFNPVITKTEGRALLMEEGCLSVPGVYGDVPRYEKIVLEGQNQSGKKVKIKAWGLLAQIFQHETDHLHGTLDVDKMKNAYTTPKSDRLLKKVDSKQ